MSRSAPINCIIAEIGSVHDGSIGNARCLIDAAADCGADIVKFQIHIFECESLLNAPNPPYFNNEDRKSYFERTSFTKEEWASLISYADQKGIQFAASAFSIEALHLLEELGVQCHKVASGEVTNVPLLREIAATKKPVYLSSGMSDWSELDAAVDILRPHNDVTVMQCTSEYPCKPMNVGLNVISEILERYKLPVGFSDHSEGAAMPIAAAALGATVIEKHLTLSKRMYGSDAANSMEPLDFSSMCKSIRNVWDAIAHPVDKNDLTIFHDIKHVFEKMLVSTRHINAGDIITASDITAKKPCAGIRADKIDSVIGRKTLKVIQKDEPIMESDLE